MNRRALLLLGALASLSSARAEVPPLGMQLLKDINITHASVGSSPYVFHEHGGLAYFNAFTRATGRELYVSDGSAAGTRLLSDLFPGGASSNPTPLGVVSGRVIVRAGATDDRQFWSVPLAGGPGTRLTAEAWPTGNASVETFSWVATPARMLFRVSDDPTLWSTDGSPAGTYRVPVDANFPIDYTQAVCTIGSVAVVGGTQGTTLNIVRTDGTPGSAQPLASESQVAGVSAVRTGNHCYLLAKKFSGGWALWASDGTVAGTVRLAANFAAPGGLAALAGAVYWSEQTYGPDTRSRLLRASVDASVPVVVAEFSGSGNLLESLLAVEDKLLFFHRSAGVLSLYLSDGTSAGTRPVYPLAPGQTFRTQHVYRLRGAAVINAWDELKRLDLATGVIVPGPRSEDFSIGHSVLLGTALLGRGGDAFDPELWRSDGTAAGSSRVKDIWTQTGDGLIDISAQNWTLIGDTLITIVTDPTASLPYRTGIWRSDGTAAGTYALPRAVYGEGYAHAPSRLGDGVVFGAGGPSQGAFSLYQTDVALSGAARVLDGLTNWVATQSFADHGRALFSCGGLLPSTTLCSIDTVGAVAAAGPAGIDFSRFTPLGEINGVALLQRDDGFGIWRSDGTLPGTFVISPGRTDPTRRGNDALFGGKRYLSVWDDGYRLVATDGTLAGTETIADLPESALSFGVLPQRLLFTLHAKGVLELWASDGSATGTTPVSSMISGMPSAIAVAGGNAHLVSYCTGCVSGYLVSDGTAAGTRLAPLPAGYRAIGGMMSVLGGGAVVFGCLYEDNGRNLAELCTADAQGNHVRAMPELSPLEGWNSVYPLAATSQGAFVVADDGIHGSELWMLRELPDLLFANGFDSD